MIALYDKTARHYYCSNETPSTKSSQATRFTSTSEARAELSVIRSLGIWPLYTWTVVRLRA